MARKTRTAQVLNIVKALAWVIVAVSLVKFAFFPAAQEEQTGDGMDRVEPRADDDFCGPLGHYEHCERDGHDPGG